MRKKKQQNEQRKRKKTTGDEEKIKVENSITCMNNDSKKDKEPAADAETGEAVKSGEKEMKDIGEKAMETSDADAKEKTVETNAKEGEEDRGKDIAREKEEASKITTGEDKDISKEKEGEANTTQVGEKQLLDLCLKGLSLCLKRFPQHFKSLYRMAYVYYHSKDHRVSQKF